MIQDHREVRFHPALRETRINIPEDIQTRGSHSRSGLPESGLAARGRLEGSQSGRITRSGNITYSSSTTRLQGTQTDEFFPIEAKEAPASGMSQGTQPDNKSPAE